MSVYFLLNTRNRLIKIGRSRDPIGRCNELQLMHTDILELLGWIPGGETTEHQYHELFRNERVYGEWFKITIRRAMQAIEAGRGRQFACEKQMIFPFERLASEEKEAA